MNQLFNYFSAFSRNLGWVSEKEQLTLKNKRIAIAGMGGVGGAHLLTLTRLGIENFSIADMDTFELANFNRQAGAKMSTIDHPKIDIMAKMATDINPELSLNTFNEGINTNNIDSFLEGVDLYVDGLDFFAVKIRREVFSACAEKNIPSITVAPLGMGAALLSFTPDSMSFEEYFQLEGHPENEQLLRFLVGLSPAMLQMGYLIDNSKVDFKAHKGPSTPMACNLCAGIAATTALKILLKRGDVVKAPYGLHFDAYKNKLKKTWRPGGNRNLLQKLVLAIARKRIS